MNDVVGVIVGRDDDHQITRRRRGLRARRQAAIVAGHGPFARLDAEGPMQGPCGPPGRGGCAGADHAAGGQNGAAPCTYIFKGHMQAAARVRDNPGHPGAGQVGDQVWAGVLHGFQQHDAEGFGALARGEAEQIALFASRACFCASSTAPSRRVAAGRPAVWCCLSAPAVRRGVHHLPRSTAPRWAGLPRPGSGFQSLVQVSRPIDSSRSCVPGRHCRDFASGSAGGGVLLMPRGTTSHLAAPAAQRATACR